MNSFMCDGEEYTYTVSPKHEYVLICHKDEYVRTISVEDVQNYVHWSIGSNLVKCFVESYRIPKKPV